MEKSERTDLQTTIIAIVAIVLIAIVTIVGLIVSAKYSDSKSQQQHETKIKSIIAKYDSLRAIDMALIAKLQEKKPVVLVIPKYIPSVKIDEKYMYKEIDKWIHNGEPTTLYEILADLVNEQRNNAYREGFRDGVNRGRREQ